MSYRDMTKPLVHKVDGERWGFTCCIGTVLPSAPAIRRASRLYEGTWAAPWVAAMRLAGAHSRMFHPGGRKDPRTSEWPWVGA